jgi:hypothetical protein
LEKKGGNQEDLIAKYNCVFEVSCAVFGKARIVCSFFQSIKKKKPKKKKNPVRHWLQINLYNFELKMRFRSGMPHQKTIEQAARSQNRGN